MWVYQIDKMRYQKDAEHTSNIKHKTLLITLRYPTHLIPLDLTYVKANIRSENIQVMLVDPINRPIQVANNINRKKPKIVIFFIDNIISSSIFCLRYAIKIFSLLKSLNKEVTTCIQSYKINSCFAKQIIATAGVDIIMMGEPEKTIKSIFKNKMLSQIKGLCYKKKESIYYTGESIKSDLAGLQSPYLSHASDKFIKGIGYLSTIRGCKFNCFYCFRGQKHNRIRAFPVKRIIEEFEYLSALDVKFIYIIDDSFITTINRLEKIANAISKKNKKEISFFANIRPELITEKTISLLKKMNVAVVQVGLQTINSRSLKMMNRTFEESEFKKKIELLKKSSIKSEVDLILGLPYENFLIFKRSFDFLLKIKPDNIRIHKLFMQPNSPIEYMVKDIKIKNKIPDFLLPIVVSHDSFTKEEFKKANEYILSKIKNQKIEFTNNVPINIYKKD